MLVFILVTRKTNDVSSIRETRELCQTKNEFHFCTKKKKKKIQIKSIQKLHFAFEYIPEITVLLSGMGRGGGGGRGGNDFPSAKGRKQNLQKTSSCRMNFQAKKKKKKCQLVLKKLYKSIC